MEILKNEKDVPTLISNLEVMYLLSKKLEDRQAAIEQSTNQTLKDNTQGTSIPLNSNYDQQKIATLQNRKFRHRNYVEEMVVDYVQSTACGNVNLEKIKDLHVLVSTLKRKPKKEKANVNNDQTTQNGHGVMVKEEPSTKSNGTHPPDSNTKKTSKNANSYSSHSNLEEGFGLTDGEVVQVLNLVPRESVEIHLVIEDLASRLSETRQEELLNALANSCLVNNTANEEEDILEKNNLEDNIEQIKNGVKDTANIDDLWDQEMGEFSMET